MHYYIDINFNIDRVFRNASKFMQLLLFITFEKKNQEKQTNKQIQNKHQKANKTKTKSKHNQIKAKPN